MSTRAAARTLVFGDDGSASADLAWAWITAHRWPGWSVRVLTAVEPELLPRPAGPDAELRPWVSSHPRVAPDDAGVEGVEHLTATRDPRLLLAEPADLLVIGPKGHGSWEALHLGSTAEWLLHAPGSPTVLARSGATVRTALAAVDGSVHAERAVAAFASLPLAAGTEIVLLAVADGRTDTGAAIGRAEALLAASGARVAAVECEGRPSKVVLDEITRRSPDLVVLGTRGLSGLARVRAGSTATTVLRRAACSLLVAHDAGAE